MIEWFEKAIDFSNIVNISITASWLILVVIGLRLILKKAPKWVNVALWGIVALRLLMPFSIESSLSLVPSVETVSDQLLQAEPAYNHQAAQLDIVTNPNYGSTISMELDDSMDSVQWSMVKMSLVWYAGIAVMSTYTAANYLLLRRKLRTAVILKDNLFQCETVRTPFVLGILKPKIYLPYNMEHQNLSHVIAHEQAHIRRKDHWWKPLGFLLLTIHWFNPLMWLAYILLCRDIELACDEKVIAELGNEQRADYTQALVACAVNRRMIAACPLAFGEVGVKERVKSVMNYKKPTFWIIIAALIICVVVAVCFLTDPNPSREFSMKGQNVSKLEPEAIVERILDIEDWESSNVYMNSNNFSLMVDSSFNWVDSQAVRYFFSKADATYSAQLRIFPKEGKYFLTEPSEWVEQNRIFLLRHYLDAVKYLPQDAIKQMAPADQYLILHREEGTPKSYDRVITYTSNGVAEINGWYIHLEILPQHEDGEGFHGTGEEVIHVFYGEDSAGSVIPESKVFADSTEDVVGIVSSVDHTEPIITQNGDILILQNEGGLWHFKEGQQVDVSVAFENDGSYMSMKSVGYIFCGDGNEGLYTDEIFADQNVYQSSGSFIAPETGNYLFYFRNYSTSWIRLNGFVVAFGSSFRAKILEIHDGYFLVEPVEGSWELSSASRIEVPMKNMEPSPEPEVGDILQIEYDGKILETFPAKLNNVYHIAVVRSGDDSSVMIPTDTDLFGCHAGALLVPIDGNIYRYELSESNPEGLTVDELLFTFTEETPIEGIVWEVYSLKEYPDKNAVLMLSGSNIAWLSKYSPPRRCSEYALNQAMAAGYVVTEAGIGTSGQDIWKEFYERTQQGKPASVTVAHYYTLDPDTCDSAYYETYKQDYPCLYEIHLDFDGKTFTLTEPDGNDVRIRTFEHLMKYDNTDFYPQSSQIPGRRFDYVLTHDNTVTWEKLFNGLVSSQMGAYIDHYSIYSERVQ